MQIQVLKSKIHRVKITQPEPSLCRLHHHRREFSWDVCGNLDRERESYSRKRGIMRERLETLCDQRRARIGQSMSERFQQPEKAALGDIVIIIFHCRMETGRGKANTRPRLNLS